MTKQIAILAIDIETLGPNIIRDEMIAFGYVLGDTKGNIISKKRYCLKLDDHHPFDENHVSKIYDMFYDKFNEFNLVAHPEKEFSKFVNSVNIGCLENFWIKNLSNLRVMLSEALDIEDQLKDFALVLDKFDELYDLRIVSDFKDYDLAFMNYYFSKYLNRNGLHYRFGDDKQYRPTYDTDSYTRGALGMGYQNPWTSDIDAVNKFGMKVIEVPSHLPDDDAEYIYLFHVGLVNKLQ